MVYYTSFLPYLLRKSLRSVSLRRNFITNKKIKHSPEGITFEGIILEGRV